MLGLTESNSSGELQYLKWINAIGKFAVDGNDNILLDLKGLIIDPASLKTGYGYITRGAAPEWVWAPTPGAKIAEPEPKGPEYQDRFKPGFYLDVFIPGTGWRPWSSNTKGCNIAVESIWPSIHNGIAANDGKCAKVAFKGHKDIDPMKVPVLELIGWVSRPGEEEPQAVQPAAAAVPVTKSEPKPKPISPPAEAQTEATDDQWF
tara:strand:+ start:696 stop:1310 length:615 start_codon:yes stop_codon:yes gene_type:complete